MNIAIVGTRNPKITYLQFITAIADLVRNCDTIVSGGAKGIDAYAKQLADDYHLGYVEYKPEYSKYGRPATFIRNQQIVDTADIVIALPSKESKGTYDTIRRAQKANKKLKVIEI